MRNLLFTSIAALTLLTPPVFAQYQNPNSFLDGLPTDCDDVQKMIDIKTGLIEYIFVQTCAMANISHFSRLN